MPSNPPQQNELNGGPPQLADALDRLAGALEEQTRTLLDLKGEVGGLAGTLKEIETRLAALEEERPSGPDPNPPKVKATKRPK